MLDLKNKADLQRLVDEGLEESLTLDYKNSKALTRDGGGPGELCKDITALANSAGGQLIYGVDEDKAAKKPSRVDDGVADLKVTREWIEQILNSRVQPRMNGVTTARIDMGNGQFGYVIYVPQTQTGPHQAPDGKYYKRFDLQSVPMHDYEIRDIMRRSTTPNLVLALDLGAALPRQLKFNPGGAGGFSDPIPLIFTISNTSPEPAEHVVVVIGIDKRLSISSTGDYVGPLPKRGDGDLAHFQLVIHPSNWTPIFKEAPEEVISKREFHVKIPSAQSIPKDFRITASVQTPGFTGNQTWQLLDEDKWVNLRQTEGMS